MKKGLFTELDKQKDLFSCKIYLRTYYQFNYFEIDEIIEEYKKYIIEK